MKNKVDAKRNINQPQIAAQKRRQTKRGKVGKNLRGKKKTKNMGILRSHNW